jgi:photosystem II stability/assembly factor-like uncharacterized protein
MKASPSVSQHPDAEVLTAFSEQSLRQHERALVMEHLSACRDCREILALALPAVEGSQQDLALVVPRRSWLSVPVLRWGVVTAGVAVLASAGFLHYRQGRPEGASPALVARSVGAKPEMTESSRPPSRAPKTASGSGFDADTKPSRQAKKMAMAEPPQDLPSSLGKVKSVPAMAKRAPAAVSGAQAVASVPSGEAFVAKKQNSFATQNQRRDALQNRATEQNTSDEDDSERLVVGKAKAPVAPETGSAGKVTPNPAAPSAAESAIAAALPLPPTQWTTSSAGHLQRSFDGGKSWQDVDVRATPGLDANLAVTGKDKNELKGTAPSYSSARFRAVFAAGNDVWAGGSGGVLFHSSDGGDTWARVIPSVGGVVLTADITAVEFADSQYGKITTAAGEIWATADCGQSWQKH